MNAKLQACLEDVRRTLAYRTAVRQGTTALEAWQWLLHPQDAWTLCDVYEALDSGVAVGVFEEQHGAYALGGHAHILGGVGERALWSDIKFRSVRWFLRYLRVVPGVRAVAVCNSLAWEMTTASSDIDLFVITRTRAMWFVRFFALLPLRLLRRRPGHQTAHPICLSFFVTEDGLDFRDVHLQPDDPHMAHWLLSMVPMIDDGVFASFLAANTWVNTFFPNARSPRVAWYRRLPRTQPWRWRPQKALDAGLMRIQMRRLPERIRAKANRSTDVIINEHMLKFHTNDRRLAYRQHFKALL